MKAESGVDGPTTQALKKYGTDAVIHFEEGLIGFSEYKYFVLLERPDIKPFRILQSIDSAEVMFLILDPVLLVPGYNTHVPAREWEAQGVFELSERTALVIASIGPTLSDSSANLQAPILINRNTMNGRQVILTDSGLSFRYPLS